MNGVAAQYRVMMSVAPIIAVIALLVATLTGVLHGDVAGLSRRVALALPLGILAAVFGRSLADTVLRSVDALSSLVAPHVDTNLNAIATAYGAPVGAPAFGMFVLTLLLCVGGVLLWIELVVRNVVLALLLCCWPLVVAGCVHDGVRRIATRVASSFGALALSKVVIVLALELGVGMMTSASTVTGTATGAATLLLATCAPFVVLRLLPPFEYASLHAADGLRTRAVRAVAGAPSHPVLEAASAVLPAKEPTLPARRADLGLTEWPAEAPTPMPEPYDGPLPPPPLEPTPRPRGRAVVTHDEFGPVLNWRWDE